MMHKGHIALLTDFGHRDHYVGVMKAVIANTCAGVRVMDLCHEIPPQGLLSGAYMLATSAPYLPEGSVVVAVVDPGVGSTRRPIAARAGGLTFVGPDNGLFELALEQLGVDQLVVLDREELWCQPVSATFHGRDIFAPCGARIACGMALEEVGTPIDAGSLVSLKRPTIEETDETLRASVIHIDHFGNLVTDLTRERFQAWGAGAMMDLRVGGEVPVTWGGTFSDAAPGEPVAYFGSFGFLEIGVNGGSAASRFRVHPLDPVVLTRLNQTR